jgi:hypothetical protein
MATRTADGAVTARTVVPVADWDDGAAREAIWDALRAECEAEAVRQQVTFSAGPEERTSQYIRFYREDGELCCDTRATEWTATDVWLQLAVRVAQ